VASAAASLWLGRSTLTASWSAANEQSNFMTLLTPQDALVVADVRDLGSCSARHKPGGTS
jgi:hypothetical protein